MKKEVETIKIEIPIGSLVIPPNKLRGTFRKMFKAGLTCAEAHPDDDSYDRIYFDKEFTRIMKSFENKKIL